MLKTILTKYNKYLPSKIFVRTFLILISICLILFIIFNFGFKKESFINKKQIETGKLTISNLLERDTDNDGIMDWEEALWGTNPNNKSTKEGILDIDYIKNKKAEIETENIEENPTKNTELTETDRFSREFLASLAAMKQSGQIDQTTINNVSRSLGEKIVDPMIIDRYTDKDILEDPNDTLNSQKKYYNKVETMYKEYANKTQIGDELEIVSIIVSNQEYDNSTNELKLTKISETYQEFSKKLLKIQVPKSLSDIHLKIANNANNTGISVKNMTKIMTDPVNGLAGLSQYEKYSRDFVSSVEELEAFLSKDDIIF